MFFRRPRAFTLIELLVVIAIIAILAAILFPVFAQARDKARQTACLSNTKQVALALYQYVQDYDEVLPMGGWSIGTESSRWSVDIQPYLKSRDVFVCPSQSDFFPRGYTGLPSGYRPTPRGGGAYGINWNLTRHISSPTSTTGVLGLAEIPSPAGTFLVVEGANCNNAAAPAGVTGNQNPETWHKLALEPSDWGIAPPTNYTGTSYLYDTDDSGGNNRRRPVARHAGGLNVVYCDGHAKWSRIEQFLGRCPSNSNKVGYCYGDPNNSWDNK
jgi:prepilin-type N-terminal cleavage/methylation domain-containing protein/prepilin-type processing-associated H-X9-DG protein